VFWTFRSLLGLALPLVSLATLYMLGDKQKKKTRERSLPGFRNEEMLSMKETYSFK
jgi:hypothetical protein